MIVGVPPPAPAADPTGVPLIVGVIWLPPLPPKSVFPLLISCRKVSTPSDTFSSPKPTARPSSAAFTDPQLFLIHSNPLVMFFSASPTLLTASLKLMFVRSSNSPATASPSSFSAACPSGVCRYSMIFPSRESSASAPFVSAGASPFRTSVCSFPKSSFSFVTLSFSSAILLTASSLATFCSSSAAANPSRPSFISGFRFVKLLPKKLLKNVSAASWVMLPFSIRFCVSVTTSQKTSSHSRAAPSTAPYLPWIVSWVGIPSSVRKSF